MHPQTPVSPARRRFALAGAALCSAPLISACAGGAAAGRPLSVGALFAGKVNDRGFMEAGWRGLERARVELGVKTSHIDSVQPRKELLAAALTRLAESGVDLVVAHGGQNNEANPNVRLLTNFSGNQDDNPQSRRVAQAQIAAGADVIFTMLNVGRDGVTEACREKGRRQIGNVIDWVQADPKVFVASAMADVGIGVFESVRELQAGSFPAGKIRKVGLANPQAVRLSMASDVPAEVRARIARVAEDIVAGRIQVPESYDGPEFATPA